MTELRLLDQKYCESEYLLKTLETRPQDDCNFKFLQQESSVFSWKVVKRRPRPYRRFSLSYDASQPSAPPSTPTTISTIDSVFPLSTTTEEDEDHLKSLLYILDYTPKYKKNLKEQRRTDEELANLLNVITITGSKKLHNTSVAKPRKLAVEHVIKPVSKPIRKHEHMNKVIKIHRKSKEHFLKGSEENSVLPPEIGMDEAKFRYHILRRNSPNHVLQSTCEQIPVDTMMDTFSAALTLNDV